MTDKTLESELQAQNEGRKLRRCKRCGWIWISRKYPLVCAKCHTAYWDTERKA